MVDVSENIEVLEEKLKCLEGEIQQYKWEHECDMKKLMETGYAFTNSHISHINHNIKWPHTNSRGHVSMEPEQPKKINYSGMKVVSQVLILADSNLMAIKPSILNKGTTTQKVFCPTLKQTLRFLELVTVEKQPDKLLLHVGTNDLEERNVSEDKIEDAFIKVFIKIREIFPHTKIIISSILPRVEMHLYSMARNLNDFLAGCCSSGVMKYSNNINIRRDMLRDKKHINEVGFKLMLSNIRSTLFGKIPYG